MQRLRRAGLRRRFVDRREAAFGTGCADHSRPPRGALPPLCGVHERPRLHGCHDANGVHAPGLDGTSVKRREPLQRRLCLVPSPSSKRPVSFATGTGTTGLPPADRKSALCFAHVQGDEGRGEGGEESPTASAKDSLARGPGAGLSKARPARAGATARLGAPLHPSSSPVGERCPPLRCA